jgi:AbrB family looped-hinge helix DNA binding protein
MPITSTVTGKPQVTIPASIARELNIQPGMRVEWKISEDGAILIRPLLSRAERAKQLEGKWKHLFPPGSDPIGDLIRERELEDEEID